MDQILERLERLVRAWTNTAGDGSAGVSGATRYSSSGDPDLDAAMTELDDYLDTSKTETERREAQEARSRAEAERRAGEARARQSGPSGGGSYDRGTSAVIEDAYRYLGLTPYAPFPDVKNAYRKLLLKYHPDRNSGSPETLKRSTETSTRINAAYQIIEAYEASKASR
ncbi:MAG: J domain-containing protein [Spirochaetes bacterium]|nr:J domain-containing protein [Spirochaetota bacterium]